MSFDDSLVGSIVSHMNEDHSDAVALYLQVLAGIEGASDVAMVSIDAEGMEIGYRVANHQRIARVDFKPPLADASELRSRLVSMVNEARKQLSD